jgi:hypothetical protein
MLYAPLFQLVFKATDLSSGATTTSSLMGTIASTSVWPSTTPAFSNTIITNSPSNSPAPEASQTTGLSTGAAAGIGVGATVIAIAIFSAFIYVMIQARRRRQRKTLDTSLTPMGIPFEHYSKYRYNPPLVANQSSYAAELPTGKVPELPGVAYLPSELSSNRM